MILARWLEMLGPFGFSPRFAKWSFLTVVSALLENRCFMVDNGGGYVYPTLYTLLIGAPATFKTTTCDRAVNDLLLPIITDTEGPFMGPSIATPAAMVKILREHNTKNMSNNFLSSPMFIYAPEWTTFYRDIGGGEMTTDLLNFFDPKPPGATWRKHTVKDGAMDVVSPALTILGCTTLKGIIDSRMMTASGTGIISRFIFVYEPSRPQGTSKRQSVRHCAEMVALQQHCRAIRSLRGEFRLTDAAEHELEALTSKELKWMRDNPADTLFASYKARRGTQMRKLSMIISVLSRLSMVIEPQDLREADALLAEIEPDMPQAFGAQIIRNDPGLIFKLIQRVPPEGISEPALWQLFHEDGQALPKGHEFHEAINGLVAAGKVEVWVNPDTKQLLYRRKR